MHADVAAVISAETAMLIASNADHLDESDFFASDKYRITKLSKMITRFRFVTLF